MEKYHVSGDVKWGNSVKTPVDQYSLGMMMFSNRSRLRGCVDHGAPKRALSSPTLKENPQNTPVWAGA